MVSNELSLAQVTIRLLLSLEPELKLKTMLNGIHNHLTEIFSATHVCLYFIDKKTEEFYSPIAEEQERVSVKFGLAGYVARTGEVVNIKDPYEVSIRSFLTYPRFWHTLFPLSLLHRGSCIHKR